MEKGMTAQKKGNTNMHATFPNHLQVLYHNFQLMAGPCKVLWVIYRFLQGLNCKINNGFHTSWFSVDIRPCEVLRLHHENTPI